MYVDALTLNTTRLQRLNYEHHKNMGTIHLNDVAD